MGERQRGRAVYVQLDPAAHEWVATDEADRQLRRWPAEQITRERILSLTVSEKRPARG